MFSFFSSTVVKNEIRQKSGKFNDVCFLEFDGIKEREREGEGVFSIQMRLESEENYGYPAQ